MNGTDVKRGPEMKITHIKYKYMAALVVMAALACSCGSQSTENQAKGEEETQAEETDQAEGERRAEEADQVAGQTAEAEEAGSADAEETAGGEPADDVPVNAVESPESRKKKEMFGEDCIAEQCFEVELNGCEGTVWFVPFAPSKNQSEFRMQIIRDGEILSDITPYVSKKAGGKKFSSLDAVSFWDVNYDGFTDIVTVVTYGDTQSVVVYYGDMFKCEEEYWSFISEEELSENLSAKADRPMTIAGIRNLLTGGKKNGEFENYAEAYEAVITLSELEGLAASVTKYGGEFLYDLIYVNEDEIPELASGRTGYFVNLYTYRDGTLYTLMNHWAYGAGGNTGYEYAARKNSMRNYNADQAGAIMNTSYMRINGENEIETPMWIESINYIDSNENGMMDEGEEYGAGPDYINGKKASPEEVEAVYAAYDMGDYQYIEGRMTVEDVRKALKSY